MSVNNETDISEDKGFGYWIGSCPNKCKKIYREFSGVDYENNTETFYFYGYINSDGLSSGWRATFFSNKKRLL